MDIHESRVRCRGVLYCPKIYKGDLRRPERPEEAPYWCEEYSDMVFLFSYDV
jgi:hypothetical protein